MKATVSINGREMGHLDELVANPTPELKEAFAHLVGVQVATPEPQPSELSTADIAELLRYEAVIKRGLESFLDVGRALMAIRDAKLYRGTHSTFEEYVGERWGISRSYAHRTISAAQVVENLLPIGNILPANEAQARPLARLEPDQQVEAWTDAVEDSGGKPTQAHVEKAVAKFTEPKPVAPPREVKRIRAETRKPEPTPARAVYVEPAPDDEVIAMLVRGEWGSDAFKQTLLEATVDQLAAAMRRIKPDADKWRYVKIGNRRELLLSAQAVNAMAVEPTPEPDAPTMPANLAASGYSLCHTKNGDTGTWGWKWQRDGEPGSGRFGKGGARDFGPFVATPEEAIGAARHHADEQATIAAVAAEQAEEDAERAARDATRAPSERAVVVEVAADSVTVAMPRHIAAALMQAAAAFKLGDMRLVDQAFLEGALQDALQG